MVKFERKALCEELSLALFFNDMYVPKTLYSYDILPRRQLDFMQIFSVLKICSALQENFSTYLSSIGMYESDAKKIVFGSSDSSSTFVISTILYDLY